MSLGPSAWLLLAAIFSLTIPAESSLIRRDPHTFINTYSLGALGRHRPRNAAGHAPFNQLVNYRAGSPKFGDLEGLRHRFRRALAATSSAVAELPGEKAGTGIASRSTLDQFLQANAGTMIMVAFYMIRIFRLLLMARIFLGTLIHINPYLPPFSFIYEMTDFYVRFADKFPTIMGVHIISEIPWLLLSSVEYLLFSLVKQQ